LSISEEEEDVYCSPLVVSQDSARSDGKRVEADQLFVSYLQQSGIKIVEPTWEDLFGATRVSHDLSFEMTQLPRFGIDIVILMTKISIFSIKRILV
jgi:hypothetical protein